MNIETNSRIKSELDSSAKYLLRADSAMTSLLLTIVHEGTVDILTTKGRTPTHGGASLSGNINKQVVESLAKRNVTVSREYVSRIWSHHLSPIVSIKGPKDDQYMEYDGKKSDLLLKKITEGKCNLPKKPSKQPAQKHDLTAVDVIEMFKKLPKKEQAKALKAIALI